MDWNNHDFDADGTAERPSLDLSGLRPAESVDVSVQKEKQDTADFDGEETPAVELVGTVEDKDGRIYDKEGAEISVGDEVKIWTASRTFLKDCQDIALSNGGSLEGHTLRVSSEGTGQYDGYIVEEADA